MKRFTLKSELFEKVFIVEDEGKTEKEVIIALIEEINADSDLKRFGVSAKSSIRPVKTLNLKINKDKENTND